jgi:uncharacterized protein
MQIYLPIAELSVDVILLLAMGGAVGVLSGLFGVGGGFLMTPILIFMGIPPTVAVASEANHLIASSVAGVLTHWRRGSLDVKMGLVLLVGGVAGSAIGVGLLGILRAIGQVDLVIALCYVVFLGTIGGLMVIESVGAVLRQRRTGSSRRGKLHTHIWLHGLPFKMRFQKSRLYISALLPLAIGFGVGILAALMGVGGGFIMVPAMIYLLGMPTAIVAGTSIFQILFVSANTTFLQAVNNQTVDVFLAMLLVIGAVVGVQVGTRLSSRVPSEQFRVLLGLMVLAVGIKMLVDLVVMPSELYSLQSGVDH